MSLRMYGQYIIQTPTPAEDPVMVGTQWYDPNTATLKICTSVSPYTFSSQSLLVAHNLLSATHPDTSPASPVRGDLITAQGASPIWTRLAVGANHAVLRSDGVDTAWGAIVAGDLPSNVAYTDQVENITGVYTFATDPVFNANAIPWAKVNKLTSSLADLATRSASDLTSGTLPAGQFPALTGDVTTVAGALATTLATVNANVGSFGSSTAIPVITVNAKGLITAISAVAPQLTLTSTYFSSLAATNLTGTAAALNIGGNAATATSATSATTAAAWTNARLLAGNSVNGSANVAFANKFIVQGTADSGLSAAQFLGALATGIVKNTTTTGVLSIAVAGDFPTLNQSTTGNAATATVLATARAINGVNFDGSAAITVAAAAGTLTGTTLAATVVTSSLTSVGTLTGGATGVGFTVALSTATITGTLADARLSANVPLLNGTNIFTGANAFVGNASGTVAQGMVFSNDTSTGFIFASGVSTGAAGRVGFRLLLTDSVGANVVTPIDSDKNGNLTLVGKWLLAASSGDLSQGSIAAGSAFTVFYGGTSAGTAEMGSTGTGSNVPFAFYNANGKVGSISTNASATAYNTSSDRRLKFDRGRATTVTVLRAIVVHDFEWKVDRLVDRGVFAQEVVAVKPTAVFIGGDDVDAVGRLRSPWAVDYSKFVPDLIVGWQQHDAQIAALVSRLEKLGA